MQYAIESLQSLKEPLVLHIIQHLTQALPDLCELPEFLNLANSCPEAIVEICKVSSKQPRVTWPWSSGGTDELIRTCSTCGVTTVVNFTCSCADCRHQWQPSPESFITYKEHPHIVEKLKRNWYLSKCPGCGKLNIFLERANMNCHSCGSRNLVRPCQSMLPYRTPLPIQQQASCSMGGFNPVILESGLFKVIVPDTNEDAGATSDASCATGVDSGCSKVSIQKTHASIFYVHKLVLASASPELLKHVHNEMREGLEGEMILRDVDKETVQTFLSWAYVGAYSFPPDLDYMGTLLAHIKLYVFGDRFNIPALKEQSFAKVTSLMATASGDKATESSIQFAIGNLPSSKEPLVAYVIQYLAHVLPDVCELPEFLDLANSCPEAIVEM
ncbi:hypothetical protein BDZ91DRAFT_457769 [Kalaharituber pfeilii]|nr:hypothetical protein BDZ91DRAFT_457769 [Kalaharituber pfeilii]